MQSANGSQDSLLRTAGWVTIGVGATALVVAIFIKKSSKPIEDRERTIADIARALYDYYLFEAAE